VYTALETMDGSSHDFELRVIVRGQRFCTLSF
jgi:hypothetical protein